MNRLMIQINNLTQVLDYYDRIKVYRADDIAGLYVELTDVNTRIVITPADDQYFYEDTNGGATHYYRTSYFNSTTSDESVQSEPRLGGTEDKKIGYTFNNYKPAPGEWGKILTADDMRYTYLWGIDATASDIESTSFEDAQFDYFIEEAMYDFEALLTIDIRTRKYITRPEINAPTAIRARVWREDVDYTDEEDPYSFDPMQWQNFGFLQLRHAPLQSVQRAILKNQVQGTIIDLLEGGWVREKRATGQLNFYPTATNSTGIFGGGVLPWRIFSGRIPDGYEIDYTTGFSSADFVPGDLRSIIGKWACIKCLASIGDGLLAGFSSQSVSLDGLSESFSSTQSATSAYFGARIKQYQDEVKTWLDRNRYKYGMPPLSFVGY